MEQKQKEIQDLVAALAAGHPISDLERSRLRTVCAEVARDYGTNNLVHALYAGAGHCALSPDAALSIFDALLGQQGDNSSSNNFVLPLLEALPIDFSSFDGNDYGDFFSTLLLLSKSSQGDPSVPLKELGTRIRCLLASKNCVLNSEELATAVRVMWNDGFSWGSDLGSFLSGLLPAGWAAQRGAEFICALCHGCIESDELDLVDFESVDTSESDAHNPAVKIGLLLDNIVPIEEQTVEFASQVVHALHQEFEKDNGERSGDGQWMRASLFAGRILQQLHGLQQGGGAGGAVHWRVREAVQLACMLCSGPSMAGGDVDWRAGRFIHAFFVGDVLKQLKKDWKPEDLSQLITALANPGNFAFGSAPAPRRIISEVLEGLGADFSLVIGRGAHPGSTLPRPGTPSPSKSEEEGEGESRV